MVTLATRLKVEKVVHANAAVPSNVVERDLATIKQLVEMGSAHPEMLRGLVWSEGLVAVYNSQFGAFTHATSDMKQDGAQLNAGSLGISIQISELFSRNIRGFDGLYVSRP